MSDPLCPTPPAVVCSADPSVCVCEEKGDAPPAGTGTSSSDESSSTPWFIAAGVTVASALGISAWQSRRSNAAMRYNSSEEAVGPLLDLLEQHASKGDLIIMGSTSRGQEMSAQHSKPLLHVVPVEAPAEAPASTANPINGHDLIVALLTDPDNPGREGEPALLRTWDREGNPTVEFLDGSNPDLPERFDGKEYVNVSGLLLEVSDAAELMMDERLAGIDWERSGMSVFEGGKRYVEFDNFRMLESEFAEIAPQLAAAEALGSGKPGTISFQGYPVETTDPRSGTLRTLSPTEAEVHAEAEAAIAEKFPSLKPEEQRAYVKVFERYEEFIWNEGLKEGSGMEVTPEQFLEMRRVHVRLLAAEFTGHGFKGEFTGMDPAYRFGSAAAYVLAGGEAKGVNFEGVTHTAMRAINERRNAALGIESREQRGVEEKERGREARPMELLKGVR